MIIFSPRLEDYQFSQRQHYVTILFITIIIIIIII